MKNLKRNLVDRIRVAQDLAISVLNMAVFDYFCFYFRIRLDMRFEICLGTKAGIGFY